MRPAYAKDVRAGAGHESGLHAQPVNLQARAQAIAKHSGDVFIPRGVDVPALDRTISYEFAPQKVKVSLRSASNAVQCMVTACSWVAAAKPVPALPVGPIVSKSATYSVRRPQCARRARA